jgi:hypothetical protein
MERLNCIVDEAAKDHLRALIRLKRSRNLPSCPNIILREGVRLHVSDWKATTDPTSRLRFHSSRHAVKMYLAEKDLLTPVGFELTDWRAMGKAIKESPPSFRLWVSKHVSGQCGVGKMMCRWGFWDSDECPLCSAPNETTRHIALCPDARIRNEAITLRHSFSQLLTALETHPEIQACFERVLRNPTLPFDQGTPSVIKLAATAQGRIGWHSTTEGRIASHWRTIQDSYYKSQGSRRTVDNWASGVVQGLLEFTQGLWKKRCELVHERDQQGLLLAQGRTLTDLLTTMLLTLPTDLLLGDRHLLTYRSKEQIHKLQPADKEIWLFSMRQALEEAKDERASENHGMRQTIREWLSG